MLIGVCLEIDRQCFEVETDHNNLRWIEASLNPAIVRMRIFMQGYHFDVRHIPGKLNIAADYLSRYHIDKESPTNVDATTANIWLDELSPLYMRQNSKLRFGAYITEIAHLTIY